MQKLNFLVQLCTNKIKRKNIPDNSTYQFILPVTSFKMNATRKVKLKDITSNLTCPLCSGYLVDATTVIECLHSCKLIAFAYIYAHVECNK